MTDERETTSVEEFTNTNDGEESDELDPIDVDTTTKEVQTQEGYELSIKSKRGSGTNDRDEVKQKVKSEDPIEPMEEEALTEQVKRMMAEMRAFQPDEDDE
jgi:hypothetical protein